MPSAWVNHITSFLVSIMIKVTIVIIIIIININITIITIILGLVFPKLINTNPQLKKLTEVSIWFIKTAFKC